MTVLFGINEEKLKSTNSYHTPKEILRQPELWKQTLNILKKNRRDLDKFFEKIGLNEEFHVIFTGAGTSEYVGNILEPYFKKNSNLDFKSVGTTEILNNPLNYIKTEKKVLLVSFARSGDSPESTGAVNIINENVKEAYHLFITCNSNGALAKISRDNEKVFLLLMPEESNDKGFAMTSSFSCMLLAGILSFGKNIENTIEDMEKIIELSEREFDEKYKDIKELASHDDKRIVVLGSGILKGLAQELSLKIMELSAGKIVAVSNTTLGFRHGPKAIVNRDTVIFNLVNQDRYAEKYDEGLLEELYNDRTARGIIAYSIKSNKRINENTHLVISPESEKVDTVKNKEMCSLFLYLIYGQMYAFFKSQYLGNETDNPFPTGEVNRVVKKFKIHEFKDEGEK